MTTHANHTKSTTTANKSSSPDSAVWRYAVAMSAPQKRKQKMQASIQSLTLTKSKIKSTKAQYIGVSMRDVLVQPCRSQASNCLWRRSFVIAPHGPL